MEIRRPHTFPEIQRNLGHSQAMKLGLRTTTSPGTGLSRGAPLAVSRLRAGAGGREGQLHMWERTGRWREKSVVVMKIPATFISFPFSIINSQVIFTLMCIYFMQNLLVGHKVLFLQFPVGYLFFCAPSSSGLGTLCSSSVSILCDWQGELTGGLIRP